MGKNIEIERKFLVIGEYKSLATKSYRIMQGYLVTDEKRTVRIRLKGAEGYITIKGEADESGFSRFEWEKQIDVEDAKQLLDLCQRGIIDKTRYEVIYDGKTFEVDEFYGDNDGLVVAELELEKVDEKFLTPSWVGKEVTGDEKYYNAYLSNHPYKHWR